MSVPGKETATIANGQTTSTGVRVAGDGAIILIEMPAAFTGTTLTVQGAVPSSNAAPVAGDYKPLYDDEGNAVVLTVAAGRIVVPSKFAIVLAAQHWIRFVSNQNEGAERLIVVHVPGQED
jgi:hypothetical protein